MHRDVELVGQAGGDAELPILPNNVASVIDQQDTIVGAAAGIGAVRRFGLAARACRCPPSGVRVPTRSASLVPMIEACVKSAGPKPNCQTMLPLRSTSITRLLNWSAIRVLRRSLNTLFWQWPRESRRSQFPGRRLISEALLQVPYAPQRGGVLDTDSDQLCPRSCRGLAKKSQRFVSATDDILPQPIGYTAIGSTTERLERRLYGQWAAVWLMLPF